MSEKQELLEDLKCIVTEILDDEWSIAKDNFNFETNEEYEAYGDTYVSSGSYITDESDTKFRESFKQNHDVEQMLSLFKTSPDFCECIKNLVKEYANEKELEV